MVISYDEAIKITQKFAEELNEKYQDKIIAVFVIGSLGSDYYRPGQSDIDTFIITKYDRNGRQTIRKGVREIADKYENKYDVPKGFGAIVVAEEQLYPPYVKEEELILEILRLKTQSKLIYGDYDIGTIPMPDKQAIIDDALSFQEWIDETRQKESVENPHAVRKINGVIMVNSTLIALKRYLMIKHGIIEFNKFKVIGLYLENNPPIVNDEAFEYINLYLQEKIADADDEQALRMTEWHDELYRVINNLVLYRV